MGIAVTRLTPAILPSCMESGLLGVTIYGPQFATGMSAPGTGLAAAGCSHDAYSFSKPGLALFNGATALRSPCAEDLQRPSGPVVQASLQ